MDIIDHLTVKDPNVPGLSYEVRLTPDLDASPLDFDVYGTPEHDAWRQGAWQYVGVVVTPVVAGTELGFAETALWAVEYGSLPVTDESGVVIETRELNVNVLAHEYPGSDLMTEARGILLDKFGPMIPIIDALRENRAGDE